MLNFLFHKTIKWGNTTPIITMIAPADLVKVMHNLDQVSWRNHGDDWCGVSPFNSFMEEKIQHSLEIKFYS